MTRERSSTPPGDSPRKPGQPGAGGTGPGSQSPSGQNLSWTIFSYLIAGMLAYGGIGWLIGHWTGHPVIFPLGMLAGLAVSIGLIIYRFGRS